MSKCFTRAQMRLWLSLSAAANQGACACAANDLLMIASLTSVGCPPHYCMLYCGWLAPSHTLITPRGSGGARRCTDHAVQQAACCSSNTSLIDQAWRGKRQEGGSDGASPGLTLALHMRARAHSHSGCRWQPLHAAQLARGLRVEKTQRGRRGVKQSEEQMMCSSCHWQLSRVRQWWCAVVVACASLRRQSNTMTCSYRAS